MRVRPAVFMVLWFILGPSLAHALALGEINLNSGLNEPLDAHIEVLSATPEEIRNLTATVASRETFERYGLDRPDFLSGLRFYVDRDNGRDVLRVVSAQPMSEPFVTFLVEAQWRRGRLLREYTVLLDPPVFLPAPQRAAAPAPVVMPRSVPSQVQPSAGQVVRQAPRRRTPPAYSGTPSFGSSYGPIRRNETLWSIAERLRTDRSISMNQMMIAIYQANQSEFLGNINLMKEGSTLRIPTRAAIESVSQREAFALAVSHNEAWRSGRPRQVARAGTAPSAVSTMPDSARLRLVEPDQAAGAASDAGSGSGAATDAAAAATLARNEADIARLSTENQQLRSDLDEIKRLLSVRDTELAQLQQQLGDGSALAGPAVSPDPTTTTDGSATDAATTAGGTDAVDPGTTVAGTQGVDGAASGQDTTTGTTTDGVTAVDTATATATDTATDATVDEPDQTGVATPGTPVVSTSLPDEPGIVGTIIEAAKGALGSLWLWIGLGVLALGGFGAMALRGRDSGDADTIDALTREAMAADDDTTMLPKLEVPAAAGDAAGDVEFFDDSGTFKPVDFAAAQAAQGAGESGEYPFEDTIGGEVQLDQSDPLAEADFHMAYGLYDQASDLVKKAAAKEPERIDLRMKLLEIFFVWGNQDEFRGTAQDLRDNMSEQIAGEWDKIVIMGKQICPDDALFAGDAGIGTGADIDLEFEPTGSQESVDLDTGMAPGIGGDAVDLDFGGALGEETAPPPIPDSGDTVEELLDLDLGGDDPLLSDVEEDETVPEPVEQIKDQIKARLSSTDTDETAEMDLSDLGVDLDLAKTGEQPVEPAPELAGADFGDVFSAAAETDSTSELPAPTTELTAGGGALDLDIGDMFGGLDSEDDEETARDLDALEESMEQTGPADTADTGHFSAEVETLHGDALDVDIGAFDDSDSDATRLIAPEGDGDAAFSTQAFGGSDDETKLIGPEDSGPDNAFSDDVFGDSADVTKMLGPDEPTGAHTEDAFSAAVFGEEETVQVPGGDDEIVIEAGSGVDLDIGESLPEGDDMTTAKVATSDLALPESGDELSEVGTKLDLARAYMDMGDPDGARGILEEVLAEGNENQQADARDMLASLS
ncbi:MAG: hypothetical protein HKO55_05380 [Gammaproteobacteria bacterium]|nr:hypothetical protein [Gammaproteobacteria bacterium]